MGRHAGEGPAGHTRILVGVAFVALVIVAAGVVLGLRFGGDDPAPAAAPSPSTSLPPPAPPPPPAPGPVDGLQESFAALAQSDLSGDVVGLTIAPVGGEATTVAQWSGEDTAWSTIKVPLSIAALRDDLQVDADIKAALTVSDNDAAERIWAALGSGQTAADKVQAVLQQAGDTTKVQPERIRPEFTPFGQTQWPLAEQVRFLSYAACDAADAPVLDLMGQVAADRWGLGRIDGSRFKGGWGPSEQGAYLVRQFGILTGGDGAMTVVAMAVQPSSGSFGEGQQDMNTIAQWLTDNRAQLPTGTCPAQP
jgi:hypothetical protein